MHGPDNLFSMGWKRMLMPEEDTSGTAGFTLIEMLVVLAIIGIIMSLVGPRVLNYLTSSKERAAEIQIQSFASAIELFYMDVGRYPTNEEGLGILVSNPAHLQFWNGPYLRTKALPQDPWGKPFTYHVPGRDAPFEISRSGPDMSAPSDEKIDLDAIPATGEPHAPPG